MELERKTKVTNPSNINENLQWGEPQHKKFIMSGVSKIIQELA